MTRESKPFPRGPGPQPGGDFTGGYWIGGILCFIAILCLSFGVAPLIKAVRNKPIVLQLPGKQWDEVKPKQKVPQVFLEWK